MGGKGKILIFKPQYLKNYYDNIILLNNYEIQNNGARRQPNDKKNCR